MHDTLNSMAALLGDHFISTLAYINFSSLHLEVDLNLAALDVPFSEEEILAAITPLKEIMPQAKTVFLWQQYFIRLFNGIHTGLDNLKGLNDSWITL